MKYNLIAIFCFLIFGCNTEVEQDTNAKLDSILNEFDSDSPGLSVCVLKENNPILMKSNGVADIETLQKINEETRFNLSSVSKQFTVFAILLLEERGHISMEDDIRDIIPELKNFKHKITLQQLANNTSGVRSHLQLLALKGIQPEDTITQKMVDDVIFAQSELNFLPNEKFSYSNSGFVLLAKVIEEITNQSYSDFLQKEIFSPLKMNHTVVNDKPSEHNSTSYHLNGDSYVKAPANYFYTGPTGIYTTIEDFSKWAKNFETHTIGNAEIFEKMNTAGVLNSGKVANYGNGQFIEQFGGKPYIWHTGSDAGYVSYIGRFPDDNLSVLILANSSYIDVKGLGERIIQVFYKSEAEVHETVNRPISDADISVFEGSYINNNDAVREVRVKEGSLHYIRKEQGNRASIVTPISENELMFEEYPSTTIQLENDIISIIDSGKTIEEFRKFTPQSEVDADLKELVGVFYSGELQEEYQIIEENGKLFLVDDKLGKVALQMIMEDKLLSSIWQFSSIGFYRNKNGKIEGFYINTGLNKNLRFVKR